MDIEKDRTLCKGSQNWECSFRVSQVFSSNAYKIEELIPKSRILRINGKYLKEVQVYMAGS